MEEDKTYSIQLRVRRTTYEDAFVAIPVTDAIMSPLPDGTGRLDFEAFVAAAIRASDDPRVQWVVESIEVAAHPVQCPLPSGRLLFDTYVHPDEPA